MERFAQLSSKPLVVQRVWKIPFYLRRPAVETAKPAYGMHKGVNEICVAFLRALFISHFLFVVVLVYLCLCTTHTLSQLKLFAC